MMQLSVTLPVVSVVNDKHINQVHLMTLFSTDIESPGTSERRMSQEKHWGQKNESKTESERVISERDGPPEMAG